MSDSPAHKPRNDELDVYGLTHPGLVRATNQDHFLTASLGRDLNVVQTSLASPLPAIPVRPDLPADERAAFLVVVADGVGGNAEGEAASRLAIEEVTSHVARSMRFFRDADPEEDSAFLDALQGAAHWTHAEILRRAASNPASNGMATTLTLWLGVWPYAYLLQVGDSRYYLLREGELTQVSRDQTVAQDLVDSGVLSPAMAQGTRWAQVLSSALGGPQNAPMVTRIRNDWSTVHLLCSDGLTKHVSDERIQERLLGMRSARQACEALLQDALDEGGEDNIAIVVGRAVRA